MTPSVLIFPMHGAAFDEVLLLCRLSGVRARAIDHAVDSFLTPGEAYPGLEWIHQVSWLDEKGSISAVIVHTLEQVVQCQILYPDIPLLVKHSINAFKEFAELGVRNFMTPSRKAEASFLAVVPDAKVFVFRKILDWDLIPKPNGHRQRSGFVSMINCYELHYPDLFSEFHKVNSAVWPISLVNYGRDDVRFAHNDLAVMNSALGLVHIKGGQAVCNAVVRAMACGTPVIMDRATHDACHFDSVEGITVNETFQDVVDFIREMQSDMSLTAELIEKTRAMARVQFTYDDVLGQGWRKFLETLEVVGNGEGFSRVQHVST